MIRSTYLVARRDYLGYVSAWGFWLGLLFTPVILAIFMFAPMLAANSQPVRYFSILENGSSFTEAFRSEMERRREAEAISALKAARFLDEEESTAIEVFKNARASGASVDEAFSKTGANTSLLPRRGFVEVDNPFSSADQISSYLSGEQLIPTEDGQQLLFAAIIINDETQEIEYWSENLQDQTLLRIAEAAESNLRLDQALANYNIDRNILQKAASEKRQITQRRARTGDDTSAQSVDSKVTIRDRAPYVVSIIMAFSLWFLIFSVINYLLMGTIEERSNKIFDSLLTSVKLPHLLAGKLIAVLLLALTLMSFWGLGSTALTLLAGDKIPPEVANGVGPIIAAAADPSLFIPAILSFVLGYLMFGSLFLALGSLCDTIQEAQTLMTPLFVTLMAPLVMLAFAAQDADSSLIQIMSWVPVFTPFLLILRMPTEPPLFEVIAQLGLMTFTTIIILYLATRVYRAGAVHGAGINDVWKFFRQLNPFARSTMKS